MFMGRKSRASSSGGDGDGADLGLFRERTERSSGTASEFISAVKTTLKEV
jgi:hypothetical protein